MKLHHITHVACETMGEVGNWAEQHGFTITGSKPYQNEPLPSVEDYDILVIMGGPQSPLKLDKYPYLREEIQCIEQAIASNKYVLGFCLGAQLIAEALGARTQHSPEKEMGIFPIHLTEAGQNDLAFQQFPQQFNVVHWHNDMPSIPDRAELLAYSEGCPHQVFRYGSRVYGLQCHMEITTDTLRKMLAKFAKDLIPSRFTQTEEQMLSADIKSINEYMRRFLDNWLGSKIS